MHNLAAIKDFLLPGLYSVFGDYPDLVDQWTQWFDRGPDSDKNFEKATEKKLFGLAQLKTEAGSIHYDSGAGSGISYNVIHQGVALGFVITKWAIRDNLYKSEFNPTAESLKRSFRQFKEITAANILNNGTVYDATTGGDGVALFSTAHPHDTGTNANRPAVDVELSEAALEAGDIGVRRFKDARGLRYLANIVRLGVPTELKYVAQRLMNAQLRPGTAENDPNALRQLRSIRDSYLVMDFLSSTKAWFLKTDCPEGFTYTQRDPMETDMITDFDTKSLKVSAEERYSLWFRNYRAGYASFPT
jgi:hypothetical protein